MVAWICRQASKFFRNRQPTSHVEEVQHRTTDLFPAGFFATLDFDMFGYGHALTSLMFRRPRTQIDETAIQFAEEPRAKEPAMARVRIAHCPMRCGPCAFPAGCRHVELCFRNLI